MNTAVVLALLAASLGLLVLVQDWRLALVCAGVCGVCAALISRGELVALAASAAASSITLLIALDIVTLVCAGAIMLWTGLTYERPDPKAAHDEVSQMELRSAMRRAARRVAPQGWVAYRLPVVALVLLAAGTALLPLSYGTPPTLAIYAWTLLLLGGILVAATSDSLLKLGIGLLVLTFGLNVCYVTQAAAVGMVDLGIFSIVPIVVAVIVALLCMAVYARLGTLRLALLFEQTRTTPTADTNDAA